MIPARLAGAVAVVAGGAAIALMTASGLAGRSAAVPKVAARRGVLPPWFAHGQVQGVPITVLGWVTMACAAISVIAGLLALRAGRRPPIRWLVLAGLAAAVLLAVVPPLNSTDMLDYVVYGRITALGHNPYVMTPAELRKLHDPVAMFAPKSWVGNPSVYGPVATAAQWLASVLGGTSAAATIFWLKVENVVAFLFTGLALDRMVGPDRSRRVRAQLLWTANPVMLWAAIGGGHVDVLGAALVVAGLWAARSALRLRSAAGGLLFGLAAAVKVPFAVTAVGPLWAARRSPRALAGFAVGGLIGLVPGYLVAGRPAVDAVVHRGAHLSTLSLWASLRDVTGHTPPQSTWLAIVIMLGLVVIFVRGLPDGDQDVRLALAFCLAWIISTPVYYPWYEMMIVPLLILMPASAFDWPIIVRALIAVFGVIPGAYPRYRPEWISVLSRSEIPSLVIKPGLLVVSLILVVMAWRRSRRQPPGTGVAERAASAGSTPATA